MNKIPPRIEDAPGLRWRALRWGWEARWRARADLAKRGFRPKVVRMWYGQGEPSELDKSYISDQCRRLQDEMLVWGRGGLPLVGLYDGTLSSLVTCYQTDQDSGFRKLRYRTRENYAHLCKRLEADHGAEPLSEVNARRLLRWHEDWTSSGVAMAHSLVGMLRTLIGFGATFLEDAECERLKGILHSMRFKMASSRKERLTAEQANAIRAMAHKMGRPSIALAQALQFDLGRSSSVSRTAFPGSHLNSGVGGVRLPTPAASRGACSTWTLGPGQSARPPMPVPNSNISGTLPRTATSA